MPNDILHIQEVIDQYNGKIPTINVAGIDYSVIIGVDAIDVICEGSHDIEDAKRDVEALMVYVPGFGMVHGGAWEGVPEAVQAIKARLDGGKPTRFKGHSLGAMRASMMAWELGRQGYTILECVTFGCPLWGNAEAVTNFNKYKNRTYQNYKDLFVHDLFTTIPLHLIEEPYVPPPNRIVGWSAPTAANEFSGKGVLIEAHSSSDCYYPLVTRLAA